MGHRRAAAEQPPATSAGARSLAHLRLLAHPDTAVASVRARGDYAPSQARIGRDWVDPARD